MTEKEKKSTEQMCVETIQIVYFRRICDIINRNNYLGKDKKKVKKIGELINEMRREIKLVKKVIYRKRK